MILQELYGNAGLLLPNAIYIPKGEEIAISQDWLIFPEAITGDGKVWTIDGLLEPCIKPDNEVWVDSNMENPFAGPITYKGKNKYGWLVGEITEDVTNELDFIDRKSIRNIILSNYVTEIPDKAFFECYDLQNIIISNSVKRIGNVAFYDCDNIQTLTIPDSVIEMGGGIFCNCYSLKYIKLPNTLTHLDLYFYTHEEYGWDEYIGFFQNCGSLLTIILPLTLQSIGNYACFSCNSLISIVIPDGVTSIGEMAFQECNCLTSVVIPNNVTSIGAYAFSNCHSLTSVTIPNSVTSIGINAFYNCSSLTSVIFNEGLTSIGNLAFSSCESLTSITIPNSVTLISEYAFYDCFGINDLILGNSVNYVGYYAFASCPLQRILSYAETPPTIKWNTFENVDRSIPLEVPNADLYREAPYWQEFYNIYNINPYQLNVSSNNEEWGYVRILEHNTNRSVIEAYYKDGYAFKQWSDGNTNTYRELNITEDTTLVAEFEKAYIPSITRMDIISATPTSITIEFEVVCDEEILYFNYGYVNYYTDLYSSAIPISYEFGALEIVIAGLNSDTDYDIVLYIGNNANSEFSRWLRFTTPSMPYSYVDLGLPSGTLWADRNVGAETPQDNGLYFSWGNVDGHAVDESGNTTDGYSFDSDVYSTTLGGQYTGSTLDAEHDAAKVNMGGEWCMPTLDETRELHQNTDRHYIGEDGDIVAESELGYPKKLRSICFVKRGEAFDYNNRTNFIEFPLAGNCYGSLLKNEGLMGYVWSSFSSGVNAGGLFFSCDGSVDGGYGSPSSRARHFGFPVRGVKNN